MVVRWGKKRQSLFLLCGRREGGSGGLCFFSSSCVVVGWGTSETREGVLPTQCSIVYNVHDGEAIGVGFSRLKGVRRLGKRVSAFHEGRPGFPVFLKTMTRGTIRRNAVVRVGIATPGKTRCRAGLGLHTRSLRFVHTLRRVKGWGVWGG